MDQSDWEVFLAKLPESPHSIRLHGFRLRSGTWKAALDAYRNKTYRFKVFSHPEGAECEEMDPDCYAELFECDRYFDGSVAEDYIRTRVLGL